MYRRTKSIVGVFILLSSFLLIWHQAALAQDNALSIEDISVQSRAVVGERVEIVVAARNGPSRADRGYVTVSFPDARCRDGTHATVEVVRVSRGKAYVIHPPGELLFRG